MRKFLMSFLLVTAAAVPAVAQAQREDFSRRAGERGVEARGDNGWRGQRAQRAAPPAQAQVQQSAPQVQAQPQISDRRGNWQSRGPARGGDSMTTGTPAARPAPPPGGWNNPDGQRRWSNRTDGQERAAEWGRGGTRQQVAPQTNTRQPRNRDWTAEQRERWAQQNRPGTPRTNDRRRDGDHDRWNNDRDRNAGDYDRKRRDRDGRRYAYRSPNGGDQWHNRSRFDNDGRFDRWNSDWRRDRRYDWRGYRSHNRDFYRLPRYANPYGYSYGYRRFSVGIFLDSLFYNDSYWIDDPFEYRLPAAYGPYRWVRYYDDVLLVDLSNGRVVDVIHDFFW